MPAELKCKNCVDRYPGCHAECESYLTWQKEHAEKKEKMQKNKWLSTIGLTKKRK